MLSTTVGVYKFILMGNFTKEVIQMYKSKQIVTDFLKRFLDKEPKQDTLLLNFTTPKILDISTNGLTELKCESDFSTIEKKRWLYP